MAPQDLSSIVRPCVYVPRAVRDTEDGTIRITHRIELSGEIFNVLWSHGFFDAVNRACGSMLDEYEEASIEPDVLPRLRDVVSANLPMMHDEQRVFLERLDGAIAIAMRLRAPLVWVL